MDSSGSPVSISALLKKTEHYDKDERYMATSDLCEVLKKKQMDGASEHSVCTAVLRLLHDKSNDVQAIAVKTLGVLLTTVKQDEVLEISDSLTDQVLDTSKSELRDVYAIGLRTLCKTIPLHMGQGVSKRILGRLLDGIRTTYKEDNDEISLACLDIVGDMLGRFTASSDLQYQHEPILEICLQCLSAPRPPVRKRAGATIGVLSAVLSDALLHRMVDSLLNQIEHHGKTDAPAMDTRALIRTMCTVSGAVGHRLGQEQIDKIIPIFLKFTDPQEATTGDDEPGDEDEDSQDTDEAAIALANELRESCFMGFESFVLRCPTKVDPHLQSIIQAALAFIKYDPNYSYGDDEEDDEDNQSQGSDAEDEDEYSDEYDEDSDAEEDDDDESWKVRRGAIRALKAVIECKHQDPTILWKTSYQVRSAETVVAEAFVERFKEREENCRIEIMDCFNRLLEVTMDASKRGVVSLNADSMSDTESIDLNTDYAAKVVRACEKVLALKGNERSKSSALSLLATLCRAPGGLGGQATIASVFKYVKVFLASGSDAAMHRENTSKALQLDALSLVTAILACDSHAPVDVRMSLQGSLLPELCLAVQEKWYKVIAEALRALACVPRFFVLGYADGDDTAKGDAEKKEVANKLFLALEPVLAATDVDQEIKECALVGTSSLLESLHECLETEQKERLLNLVLERLSNETTRIAAMKALLNIAKSENKVDISCVLAPATSTVSGFLKLQSRSSKQSALEALDVIVRNHGDHETFSDGTFLAGVLKEFTIVDSDLHLSHLALRAAVSILAVCPAAGGAIKETVLPQALEFSTSSLVQDAALDSLLALYKIIVETGAVPFDDVLLMIRQLLNSNTSKHGIYNLAKCVSTVATSSSAENLQKVLNESIEELQKSGTPGDDDSIRKVQLLLLGTGGIGLSVDLAEVGVADSLKTIYLGYFDSKSEELGSAAAHALGNASVGSQASFLPAIVAKLDEDKQKQQYLLLSSLRDYIQSNARSGNSVSSSLDVVLPPLEKHCADEEEGVRAMVAECMGSVMVLHPTELLQKLGELLNAHSTIHTEGGMIADEDKESKDNSRVCWTIASAIKHAASSKINADVLAVHLPNFLVLLSQEELQVRLAALQMAYSVVYHCPKAVASTFKDVITPVLYEVAALVMKRKVDLGPFTHTTDDALQLRVTTLSIFSTSLEKLPGSVDVEAFMPVLAKALGDAEDIQLHAHQVVLAMCSSHPVQILKAVDSFAEPLEKTTNKKAGQKAGTELERFNDWIKSAIRVALTVSKLEGVVNNGKFVEFVNRLKSNPKHTASVEALLNED